METSACDYSFLQHEPRVLRQNARYQDPWQQDNNHQRYLERKALGLTECKTRPIFSGNVKTKEVQKYKSILECSRILHARQNSISDAMYDKRLLKGLYCIADNETDLDKLLNTLQAKVYYTYDCKDQVLLQHDTIASCCNATGVNKGTCRIGIDEYRLICKRYAIATNLDDIEVIKKTYVPPMPKVEKVKVVKPVRIKKENIKLKIKALDTCTQNMLEFDSGEAFYKAVKVRRQVPKIGNLVKARYEIVEIIREVVS